MLGNLFSTGKKNFFFNSMVTMFPQKKKTVHCLFGETQKELRQFFDNSLGIVVSAFRFKSISEFFFVQLYFRIFFRSALF